MKGPVFDERAVLPERLPMDAFQWFCDATMYATNHPDSGAELYGTLRNVLRMLALHPDGQSESSRLAFGTVIEQLMKQKDREKICLDMTALLTRVIDSKRNVKYDPSVHMSVAGLGFLARYTKNEMRQLSYNYYVLTLDLLKVAPSYFPIYQETLLWTLTMSCTPALDLNAVKGGYRYAKGFTSSEHDGLIIRSYDLLAELAFASEKDSHEFLVKKLDTYHSLYLKGLDSVNEDIRDAAIKMYVAAGEHLSTFQRVFQEQASLYKSYAKSTKRNARQTGILLVLKKLIQSNTSLSLATEVDDWLFRTILSLGPENSRMLLVDTIAAHLIMSEQGRLDMTQTLVRFLATNDNPIDASLSCIQGMVNILGDAVAPVADAIQQSCLAVLNQNNEHPSIWSIAIQCLKSLVEETPHLFISTTESCLLKLEAGPDVPTAYLLASLLQWSAHEPIYGSVEINGRVILLATDLIDRLEADLLTYSTGWILMSGVLALGSRVIKRIVPQLLLLWETHLPKTINFPRHLTSALTGMIAFMAHNPVLLTTDVTHRIAKVLYDLWQSTNIIAASVEPLLKVRLLECFYLLAKIEKSDIYPSSMLTNYASILTDPDSPDHVDKSDLFDSAVKHSDLCGLTSLIPGSVSGDAQASFISLQNDVAQLLLQQNYLPNRPDKVHVSVAPLKTVIVDKAILVVAALLPVQPVRVQESLLDLLRTNLETAQRKKKGLRRFAIYGNVAVLIWSIVCNASASDGSQLRDSRVVPILIDIVDLLLTSASPDIRELAARSCGALAKRFESADEVTALTKDLMHKIIADLDPVSRSSRLVTLGYIVESCPRKFTSSCNDDLFKIFTTLSKDPVPQVHISVLNAIHLTLKNTEPLDRQYIKQSLQISSQCYILETHRSRHVRLAVARILALVVTAWGPEIASKSSVIDGVLRLVDQLQRQSEPEAVSLAWQCLRELYYYARTDIAWPPIVKSWCDAVGNRNTLPQLTKAAVSGLRILFEISSQSVLSLAGPSLEKNLWLCLNQDPDNYELKELLLAWMNQTAPTQPELWVERLQTVVMKPLSFFLSVGTPGPNDMSAASTSQNRNRETTRELEVADEDESLGVAVDVHAGEPLGWEARLFAIDLLHKLVQLVHIGENSGTTRSIGDIIKIAFSAATSTERAMQVAGLALLNELIEKFGDLKDPDFPQISLLEQYQVQITSALTPAFGRDSSPGLALAALESCGIFLSSNIIKSAQKLTRIVKILQDSVESIRSDGHFNLGKLDLSPNAAQILKVAVLRVWAQIKIASQNENLAHLVEVVEPLESLLAPLWLEILKEYALLRFEPEESSSGTSISETVKHMESEQLRQVVMPTYRHAWLILVHCLAIGGSMENDDAQILFCLCLEALIRPQFKADVLAVLLQILRQQSMGCTTAIFNTNGVFNETMTTLYRCVLGGTCAEQLTIVDIMRTLAVNQKETDESVDYLIDILRVAILPLKALVPRVFGFDSRRGNLGPDELKLLSYSLDALIDIVQVFREVIRNDLWVCLLRIFETIVGEEDTKVQGAVQSPFKRLLEAMSEAAEMSESSQKLVQGSIKAIMRRALEGSGERTLHTCMLIVCSNTNIELGRAELMSFGQKCAFFLVKGEDEKSILAAAQCIRTVVQSTSGQRSCVPFIQGAIPQLIATGTTTDIALLPKIICDTLFSASVANSHHLSIAIPALVAISENQNWLNTTEREAYVRRVLFQLVAQFPAGFKEVVSAMSDESDRISLQELLVGRSEHGTDAEDSDEDNDAEIVLTSFV